MRQHRVSTLVVGALAVAIAFDVAGQSTNLLSQQNNEAHVTVTVTALALSDAAETWRFDAAQHLRDAAHARSRRTLGFEQRQGT